MISGKAVSAALASLVATIAFVTPAEAPRPLTYPDALGRAVEVDERLAIREASRRALGFERAGEKSLLRPSLDLAASVSSNRNAVEVQFGGPMGTPRTIQDTVQGDARVEARWSLYEPSRNREIEALDREIGAAGADRSVTEATVRYEAAMAYLDLLEFSAQTEAARAYLAGAKAVAEGSRLRLEAGEGSHLGAAQLRFTVDSLEAGLLRSEALEAAAAERLRHILALDEAPSLPGRLGALLPQAPGEFDTLSLVETARRSRPEVASLKERVEASRARVAAASAKGLPGAEAVGSLGASTVEGFDGETVDARVEVGLRWTFFDAGGRASARAAAFERLRMDEIALSALLRRVESEVRQAFQGLRMARAEEARLLAEEERAKAALEERRALQDAGSAAETDVAESRARLAAASALLDAARVQTVRSFVALRFAAGAPIPDSDGPGGDSIVGPGR